MTLADDRGGCGAVRCGATRKAHLCLKQKVDSVPHITARSIYIYIYILIAIISPSYSYLFISQGFSIHSEDRSPCLSRHDADYVPVYAGNCHVIVVTTR